jgi:hypothetical protein
MFVQMNGLKETICLRRVLQRTAEAIIGSTNDQKLLPPPHEDAHHQSLFPTEARVEDLPILLLQLQPLLLLPSLHPLMHLYQQWMFLL